jgi:hypothetical protein
MMNNYWIMVWKQVVLTEFEVLPIIFWGELRTTTKALSQDSHCHGSLWLKIGI